MSTLKTAISIDEKIFRKVDALSKKLHITRSQFFAQAARYMVERDENCDLLCRINDAYASDADEKLQIRVAKQYLGKRVTERW
ncbi:MAG: ribbon-helix-helix protein, CopG family [Chitinispirillaceae bacterium]|nr:ribbon-helix-helix protein, CopG family [Chitinispirillaceae bacterium]